LYNNSDVEFFQIAIKYEQLKLQKLKEKLTNLRKKVEESPRLITTKTPIPAALPHPKPNMYAYNDINKDVMFLKMLQIRLIDEGVSEFITANEKQIQQGYFKAKTNRDSQALITKLSRQIHTVLRTLEENGKLKNEMYNIPDLVKQTLQSGKGVREQIFDIIRIPRFADLGVDNKNELSQIVDNMNINDIETNRVFQINQPAKHLDTDAQLIYTELRRYIVGYGCYNDDESNNDCLDHSHNILVLQIVSSGLINPDKYNNPYIESLVTTRIDRIKEANKDLFELNKLKKGGRRKTKRHRKYKRKTHSKNKRKSRVSKKHSSS
jgi:hypothetical protein